MRILLTGANGFLGHTLVPLLLHKGFEVTATGLGPCRLSLPDHPHFRYFPLDFTDQAAVQKLFSQVAPAVVIHAGAMTQVDACELQQEKAWLVNVKGTENLLEQAAVYHSYFLYVSTDFIFSGEKGMYTEEDSPAPVNYYGRTKLEGEESVKKYNGDWAIVRTCLVYGKRVEGRNNIVSLLRDKLEKKEIYSVVDDQFRTPTFVEDLAAGIAAITERRATGVFHISGEELLTPYRMALQVAAFLGLDPSVFTKVTAADFTQPALRPPRTGFNISKAKMLLGYQPLRFEEGLRRIFI